MEMSKIVNPFEKNTFLEMWNNQDLSDNLESIDPFTGTTMFEAGIPKREERRNRDDTFIYPEEIIGKTCGECVRCEPNRRDPEKWRCTMRSSKVEITPEHKACVSFWDLEEHQRIEFLKIKDTEERREELRTIYSQKEPIKLPILFDGYGRIPKCPVCGEMPYSTEQCHWCGQRFIQDEAVQKYSESKTVPFTCPSCGKEGIANISAYNGHKHFKCKECGCSFMQ